MAAFERELSQSPLIGSWISTNTERNRGDSEEDVSIPSDRVMDFYLKK